MSTRKAAAHVYLLHFTPKLAHAGHYCGHTPNGVKQRIRAHLSGHGACITRAAVQAGCTLTLVRTWEFETTHEARLFERALKNTKNMPQYCPICRKLAKRKSKSSRMAGGRSQA